MELNTTLWALSYPEVRKERPRQEIEEYVRMAQDGIRLASERWPGVESALELYEKLIKACLKAYDSNFSYVVRSPLNKAPSASSNEGMTPPPLSNSSSVVSSTASPKDRWTTRHSLNGKSIDGHDVNGQPTLSSSARSEIRIPDPQRSIPQPRQVSPHPAFYFTPTHQSAPFDPHSLYNTLPADFTQSWNPGPSPILEDAELGGYPASLKEPELYFDAIGDQYSQYLHAPYVPQQPLRSLSQEQQVELMTNLERTGLRMINPMEQAASSQGHPHIR